MKRSPNKQKAPVKAARQKEASEPQTPLTPGRKWLFRFIALVIVPALLVFLVGAVLEMGLRIGGYGYDTGFFRSIQENGQTYLLNNEKFCQRFFPPQLTRWPDPFKMAAVKPADTVRIFVFGESAAMGDPQPAYGASRYMEALLRERFPQKKIEVINTGITAINSHVILPIARECAAQHGDFWIIYMGNNEMVGPFGAATVFGARASPLWAARLNIGIQRLRAGQLLVAGLRHFGGKSKNTSWGGMEMFLENQIGPEDPRKPTVYHNFEGNLRDIVSAGVNSGAKVILNTVSVNLKDCPPFASFTDSNLPAASRDQFRIIFDHAKSLQAERDFQAAAGQFKEALKLEPQYAEAHFRLGQCEVALSNAAAGAELQAACDLDALPFRADTRINAGIRNVAQAHASDGVVLADAEQLLGGSSPGGAAGDETFYEHVHFNFDGNYRLGRIWAEQVGKALTAAGAAAVTTNWAAQADCERDLALSIWNREFVLQAVARRMGVPPLSTQFNNDAHLQAVRARELSLRKEEAQPGASQKVRQDYAAAIQRGPDDAYLYEGEANFFEAVKDLPAATSAYRQLVAMRPDHFYACLQLGRVLVEQNQPDQAEPYLRRAVQLRPSLPDAWSELGNALAAGAKLAPALECMEHAATLRPQDTTYLVDAAGVLAKLNRHAEAIEHYRRAIQINSTDWQAHFQLAGELVAADQASEAINEYSAALKINPQHTVSYINLGVVLVRFNRLDDAIQCFQNALKLEPDNQIAQNYLSAVQAHKNQQLK